jgi:hypothetical protein
MIGLTLTIIMLGYFINRCVGGPTSANSCKIWEYGNGQSFWIKGIDFVHAVQAVKVAGPLRGLCLFLCRIEVLQWFALRCRLGFWPIAGENALVCNKWSVGLNQNRRRKGHSSQGIGAIWQWVTCVVDYIIWFALFPTLTSKPLVIQQLALGWN